MHKINSKTIVFIHGMYMTPLCWEHWLPFFQSKGYTCTAPAWPEHDKPIEELRKPDLRLAGVTLKAIIESMADKIKALNEKPIIIGHSIGGLVVQILLQRDIAAAGVAINPAPPLGVLTTRWEFLKSNWPHINPFASKNEPITMSFERFQYCFVNDMPLEEQRAAYERYAVPESRRVPADTLTGLAAIDFKRPHAPLLMTAGSNDHLIPASLNKTNFNRYKDSTSVTTFNEFAGRTHFIIGQKGWEEVAGYTADWLNGSNM